MAESTRLPAAASGAGCGQENYHSHVLDALASGVLALDLDGRVIAANEAACAHLGINPSVLAPGAQLETVPRLEIMAPFFEQVLESKELLERQELLLDTGEEDRKEIGLSAAPLMIGDTIRGVVFLFTDMTVRRKFERAAEINRQLAALGELTAGVVHELRNPMSVISAMAEILMRKLAESDERYAAAETIFREAGSVEKAISQFLGFARPYDVHPVHCSPGEIADRAIQLCSRRAEKYGVTLHGEIQPNLPPMQADVGRAAQALANIINNGIDAAGENGRVSLAVRREGNEIVFEITDTGEGIQLKSGEDVFKPFFTLKEGGTGLGLAIVHRIITAHNGSVRHGNRPEGGACFEVRLPVERGALR
ncbi:MAG: two-component system sensor histidine kinase NtrB [Candidatus Hydrogenedentales bacterium]|jgi:signal transduction histidine kinase